MAEYDKSRTPFCQSATISVPLCCTIFELLTLKNMLTLKSTLKGHCKSLELAPFDRPHTTSYWRLIVTVVLSYFGSEIMRDICRTLIAISSYPRFYITVTWERLLQPFCYG